MFDEMGEYATVGDLRRVLIDLYGLDHDYVYGMNDGVPQESDAYFLPWGWDDEQYVDREPVIYAAVKVHDPSIVADWSSIKDDKGVRILPVVKSLLSCMSESFPDERSYRSTISRKINCWLNDMIRTGTYTGENSRGFPDCHRTSTCFPRSTTLY